MKTKQLKFTPRAGGDVEIELDSWKGRPIVITAEAAAALAKYLAGLSTEQLSFVITTDEGGCGFTLEDA